MRIQVLDSDKSNMLVINNLTDTPKWGCLIHILCKNSVNHQTTFHWTKKEGLKVLPAQKNDKISPHENSLSRHNIYVMVN